ncbi:MAG TPA: helix-turn-helix domain-containing protein [Spirochaetota bacterium]|nr:helix-turn-helix domain-containing protein [Spirochaetota bacterium]
MVNKTADSEQSLVESLVSLGLTNNEARIYLYLVKKPNSNGYEISKNTGISRSLVYGGLEKLKNGGFLEVSKSVASSYVIKPIEELEYDISKSVERSIQNLKKNLLLLTPEKEEELFFTITNKKNQLKKMSFLVKNAKKSLYISAGTRELEWIKKDLFNLKENVEVHIFSFTNIDEYSRKFKTYSRNMEFSFIQSENNLKDNRRILIVKDEEEMLLCGGRNFDEQAAIYTKNKMMVQFATEHFMHDVKIYNIEKKYNISDDTHLLFGKK